MQKLWTLHKSFYYNSSTSTHLISISYIYIYLTKKNDIKQVDIF